MKNKKLFAILTLVCFMFTLMPVAAFAAVPVADTNSVVWTADKSVDVATEAAKFTVKITDAAGDDVTSGTELYVWVTKGSAVAPVNTVVVTEAESTYTADKANLDGTLVKKITKATGENFWVRFFSTGNYTVHVSAVAPTLEEGKIVNASEFNAAGNTVEVGKDADDTTLYRIELPAMKDNQVEGPYVYNHVNGLPGDWEALYDGSTVSSLDVDANNVTETEVKFALYNDKNKTVAGATIDIEVAGAISVDKESVVTNALGEATFKVAGNREGVYKIYLSTGKYESVIEVVVGAIGANSIKADAETAPHDLIGDYDFAEVIEFDLFDVNGNKLNPAVDKEGWKKAADSTNDEFGKTQTEAGVDATGYVAVVSQPEKSKIENEDLYLDVVDGVLTIKSNEKITAEGEYTFKVVLDNGAYVTVSCTVKAFDKPVQLVINAPANIELGATVAVDTEWIDANGVVETETKGVEVVATGYAVKDFSEVAGGYELDAKSDEKYVGAVITLTAVDERYNLVATKEITIANEAKELAFTAKTAAVNVNNYIDVNVVDADGKVVSLAGNDAVDRKGKVEINYVILDKPEGANVFVTTYEQDELLSDGVFTMNLTSNKVGNVAVQAVVKYTAADATDNNKHVTKYYTGTQIFAVGTEGVGDVVVMSIGSNEIVINDAKAAIDAAPIVENNRTFVPFRALAEAFGATVAYDEATQAVTAELNGVTVVMTIGSAEYTVNGESKTADVAPFINGSRTMVPVRFAAEAFGIKVIPTYDENGATADILFNL